MTFGKHALRYSSPSSSRSRSSSKRRRTSGKLTLEHAAALDNSRPGEALHSAFLIAKERQKFEMLQWSWSALSGTQLFGCPQTDPTHPIPSSWWDLGRIRSRTRGAQAAQARPRSSFRFGFRNSPTSMCFSWATGVTAWPNAGNGPRCSEVHEGHCLCAGRTLENGWVDLPRCNVFLGKPPPTQWA